MKPRRASESTGELWDHGNLRLRGDLRDYAPNYETTGPLRLRVDLSDYEGTLRPTVDL